MMIESDLELIQACRQGDSHAWERLLDKYERLVFSIPLNYGLTLEDAADITQITFTILMENLDSLRDDTRLGGWLTTVAKRHTWRSLHHQRRETIQPDGDIGESDVMDNEPSHFERWERLDWLNHGLNSLDERCRELLLALYFDPARLSYAQVAERLHMPLGSIGPTRARCLENLKKILVAMVQG